MKHKETFTIPKNARNEIDSNLPWENFSIHFSV